MSIKGIDFPVKELEKMNHIENFVQPEKTILDYQTGRVFKKKSYVVAILRKKDKKHASDYYEPVYLSPNLDSTIFVYNNVHVFDIMNMKRNKTLLRMKSEKGEMLQKITLLEQDFDKQQDKSLLVVRKNDLKVSIIGEENDDLFGF